MAADLRLAQGGRIDRSRPITVHFNGQPQQGFAGDTLASTLLANRTRLVGRSFRYHRPRGLMGAGLEEVNGIVQLAGEHDEGNVLATRLPIFEGLTASSVNARPSVSIDMHAVNDRLSGLLPAGFYYKTFMWPHWHRFEPAIRRAAGLAKAPTAVPESDAYEKRFHHCDVLIAGAGPAGLAAALVAGRSGARVLLVDDRPQPGGRLLDDAEIIDDRPALDWVAAAVAELDAMPDVIRLADATVWGYYDHNFLTVNERRPDKPQLRQRNWKVRARQVVLATGAIERPLVFANNDRPGIMLASAARAYLHGYAVRAGESAVLFTNNDDAYTTAFDLADNGTTIAAIVDVRQSPPTRLTEQAQQRKIELLRSHVVVNALGSRAITGAQVVPLEGGGTRRLDCDLLCCSGGWNPAVHLFSQSGGKLRYDPRIAAIMPHESNQAEQSAGACNGAFELPDCIAEGAAAGAAAASATGLTPASLNLPTTGAPRPYSIEAHWSVAPRKPGLKAFVDLQNDVTLRDVRIAIQEGYESVEHLKRYTTAGMGFDQGKTGNVNVIGAMSEMLGMEPGDIGTTTFRPPYTPVSFGSIAGGDPGPLIRPSRATPMTSWHERAGAVMYESGSFWRRPGYYPKPGESMDAAIGREAGAVRNGVGIYDGSPLGKLDVSGQDAEQFLDRIYSNLMSTLKPGHGRYGLMLQEDGRILDDGVAFRLAKDRFLVSTSTGHAHAVEAWLGQLLHCEWPDLQVHVTRITEQWSNATICGPLAREVLSEAGTDIDLSREAFPFMGLRDGRVAGLPARVIRVSFTGELSFEVNVPSRHGLALWEALMAAGVPHGITPVGSEANHVLRVEKGFLSLAHEVDGNVTPHDLGLGWLVSRKKPDFIGKRSLDGLIDDAGPRRQLVGLLPEDPADIPPEGAPITPGGRMEATEGHVTAAVHSVALGRSIALALLDDGQARHDAVVAIPLPDGVTHASVTKPVFYDLDGERLRS